MLSPEFWHGRAVFLTGHTGFKGGWLATWLAGLGARVTGYALPPHTNPSFFELCGLANHIDSVNGDVRDYDLLTGTLQACRPEIVFHLAAQPIVLRSYQQPVETLTTNILGTAHFLEAVRHCSSVRAVVVITSDKCYQIRPGVRSYQENDPMGGHDPYSASKACAELVAAAYQHSFFHSAPATVATVRAGNVIGGGDWSEDRILPDAIRALHAGRPLGVRNPYAVRPWQHVLEPLCGYLTLAERLYAEPGRWQGGWNFGPHDAVSVSTLAAHIVRSWGDGAAWRNTGDPGAPHEDAHLHVDSTKARRLLGWHPRLPVSEAVEWSVAWYREALRAPAAGRMYRFTREQIDSYEAPLRLPAERLA